MLTDESGSGDLRGRIHRIYQTLATAPTLAPGARIDALFSDLVRLARTDGRGPLDEVLGDPIVRAIQGNLQRVCASGEFLLEAHWARKVAECPGDPWQALRGFPYFENYRQLCRLEMSAIASAAATAPARALFVGAGPLPLTSVVLAREHAIRVRNVDVDVEACGLAERVSDRLGLGGVLEFRHADVLELDDLAEFDVILLASLVGLGRRDKSRVLEHLGDRSKPGTLLVVRSAARLRTLLYPRVDLEQLGLFEPLLEVHPHNEVINSIIVARRRS